MWSIIASALVFFHLALELAHYVYEYYASRRGSNILIDIQRHRMRSHKTEMLKKMLSDLDLIKQELGIDECRPIPEVKEPKEPQIDRIEIREEIRQLCDFCGKKWSPRHLWHCEEKKE